MIFTIGHSNHSLDVFGGMLKRHNIDTLVDVRSSPFSAYTPQYNHDEMLKSCRKWGISYIFLGYEAGGRPEDDGCYVDGKARYDLIAATKDFRGVISDLTDGYMKGHRVALMCSEKEPMACHRTVLIAEALEKACCSVSHILHDGSCESHYDTMKRMIEAQGMKDADLFASGAAIRKEALAKQEAKIAFVKPAWREAS